MKKTFFLAMLVLSFSIIQAQNSAVTNAILYRDNSELLKAKQSIDQAVEHEKTKNSAKAWYYKGLIYSDIYKSDKVEVKETVLDPLKQSTEALLKAKELESATKGEFYKLADNQLNENWVNLINRGIAYHQSKKYQDALDMYVLAQAVKPADTTAYVYAAYSAEATGKEDLLKTYSEKLYSLNYKNLYVYSTLIQAAFKEKNYDKAISLSNEALAAYPMEKVILENRSFAYIEAGKADEGIEVLKNELKSKPFQVDLLTSLSMLYSAKKDNDKALEVYNKIIAIEPHHYLANFNAAVINFEKGKELTAKKDHAGAKILYEKSLENAKRAKALAAEDQDVDNLKILISELNIILGK